MHAADRLDPLFSPAELAEYLDVPVATLYAWRYHGEGPPGFRVGRHVRYRLTDVEQWLESRLDPSLPSAGDSRARRR